MKEIKTKQEMQKFFSEFAKKVDRLYSEVNTARTSNIKGATKEIAFRKALDDLEKAKSTIQGDVAAIQRLIR